MNCERYAASTKLCLTISKTEVSLRFPSEKSQLRPQPKGLLCRSLDSKKKLKKKKEEERIEKKNATYMNQQLYQKNYHSGLKDKCS